MRSGDLESGTAGRKMENAAFSLPKVPSVCISRTAFKCRPLDLVLCSSYLKVNAVFLEDLTLGPCDLLDVNRGLVELEPLRNFDFIASFPDLSRSMPTLRSECLVDSNHLPLDDLSCTPCGP